MDDAADVLADLRRVFHESLLIMERLCRIKENP